MTNWDMWHAFMRAVQDGRVDPLLHDCHDAGRLYLQADDDYEPILGCYMCRILVRPTVGMVGWVKQQLQQIGYENF